MSFATSQQALNSTFKAPGSANVAPVSYRMLEGDWPVLQQANPVSVNIMDRIKSEASGSAITSHIGYISLGCFFIHTDLLEPHPTQRPISQPHVQKLRDDFARMGVLRMEHVGVVIGLGNGWGQMKNQTPNHYMISTSCPHLPRLANTHGGPIAQIIRGNHRTAAIRNFSKSPQSDPSQNYWFYQVLLPSMFSIIIFLFY